jgi:hypothetical protein
MRPLAGGLPKPGLSPRPGGVRPRADMQANVVRQRWLARSRSLCDAGCLVQLNHYYNAEGALDGYAALGFDIVIVVFISYFMLKVPRLPAPARPLCAAEVNGGGTPRRRCTTRGRRGQTTSRTSGTSSTGCVAAASCLPACRPETGTAQFINIVMVIVFCIRGAEISKFDGRDPATVRSAGPARARTRARSSSQSWRSTSRASARCAASFGSSRPRTFSPPWWPCSSGSRSAPAPPRRTARAPRSQCSLRCAPPASP